VRTLERDQVPVYRVIAKGIQIGGLEQRYQAMPGQIVGLGRYGQGVHSVEWLYVRIELAG
jgi:hypothetical protein